MDVLEIDRQLMEALQPVIKGFVDRAINRAVEPLLEKIAALEAREPVIVEKAITVAEPPRLDEFRHEFGAFMAECRADVFAQKAEVQDALVQLPAPADLLKVAENIELHGKAAIGELTGKVAALDAHLRERADATEARVTAALEQVKDGAPGRDGVDGQSVDPEQVRSMVATEVKTAVDNLPKPQDGHSPTEDEIAPLVQRLVEKAVAAIPAPQDGVDGRTPTADEVQAIVAVEVKAAVDALPPAEAGPRGDIGPQGEPGVEGPKGEPGSPPDPDEIAEMVRREIDRRIADLPPPRDGIDGRDGKDGTDGKSIDHGEIEGMVGDAVANAVAKLQPARDGVDGTDGKDADPDLVKALVVKEVDERMAAIPRPQDGRDGRDGKDADWTLIERHVEVSVKQAVAEIPRPKDGRDGVDGKSVDPAEIQEWVKSAVAEIPKPRDGIDGKSVTIDDLRRVIEGEVEQRVASIPIPKDGRDGVDGKDGAGIEDAFIGGGGELILTFSSGRVKNLGAGFAKDINIDAIREMIVDIDMENEKGVWEPGPYKKASRVTYGGSRFLAKEETTAEDRPLSSGKWVMINQRGRDGRDAAAPKKDRPALSLPTKDAD